MMSRGCRPTAASASKPDPGRNAMPTMRFEETSTEEAIAELARSGNEELRRWIIERQTPLVQSLAHKFVRPGVPVEDLEQVAWLALIRALDRYDPAHGTKFSTYAIHCMVGEIKRYFRDRTWAIKAPRQLQDAAIGLDRKQDELRRALGREPSIAEMARAFDLSEENLAHAMELRQNYTMQALEDRFEEQGGPGLAVA